VSTQPPRLRVVLEPVDAGASGDVPAIVRLRQLLKSLLRRWQFRCLRVTAKEEQKEGRS
jgi:hypothetical protein